MESSLNIDGQIFLAACFIGEEALAKTFHFQITFAPEESALQWGKILGHPGTFLLPRRAISGIITGYELTYILQQPYYCLTLEPRLALLKREKKSRTWLNTSIAEIIYLLLENIGYEKWQIQLAFDCPQATTEIQLPTENQLDFLQRILAKRNILYHFDSINGYEKITFFTQPYPWQRIAPVTYAPSSGQINPGKTIHHITLKHRNALTAKSSLDDFFPGSLFYLKANNYHHSLNNDYYVTHIHHLGKKINSLHHSIDYKNKIMLLPINSPFKQPLKPLRAFPLPFLATVESASDIPYLDKDGTYRVRYHWDNESPITQASPKTILLSFSLGISNNIFGFHSPIYPGCQVLINCLYEDPCQPIILGVVADESANSYLKNQSVLASQQHKILFSNEDDAMLLSGYHGKLTISMGPEAMTLMTQQGIIALTAKKTITVSSNGSLQENCKEKKINVNGNYTMSSSTLSFQGKTRLAIETNHTLHCQGKNAIRFNVAKQYKMYIKENYLLEGSTLSINASTGNITALSKNITLHAAHTISLQQQKNRITMGQHIDLTCQQLHINAKNKIILKGKVESAEGI